MTFGYFVLWFVMCLAAYAVVFAVQIPLRRKCRPVLRIVVWVLKVAMTAGVAYVVMVVPCWFSSRGVYPTVALQVALLADVISDLIMIPVSIIRNRRSGNDRPYLAINFVVSLVVTVAVVLYGTINMQVVRRNEVTYRSEKITQAHKFVFVSDVHMGAAQSSRTIAHAIERIRLENPDFVVLGGDIVDEFTSKGEMWAIFQMFGNLGVPTYYVYGNHDRQPNPERAGGPFYTPQELEEAIKGAGITIVDDSIVLIGDDLVMLGREAYNVASRKDANDLPEIPEGAFLLCIDHSPYEWEDIRETGADLQVSGHSHAGQLFPMQMVYELAGYIAYGKYRIGDTDLFVSSGFGGWGVPFKSEGKSEYVVVNLLPAE